MPAVRLKIVNIFLSAGKKAVSSTLSGNYIKYMAAPKGLIA